MDPLGWATKNNRDATNTWVWSPSHHPNRTEDSSENKKNGFFIDIGAYDGVYIDNTYILEKEYNWNGICIEANPIIFSELQNNRSCTCVNSILGNNEDTVYFEINQIFND